MVLYPLFGDFIPIGRGRGGGGVVTSLRRRGMAPLYVNLEPQYRKTSSGMEVGEVMEGEGTTYVLHSVYVL